jgi:hypothetical protein
LTLPGPGVPAIRWATRPGGLAAIECRAGPARSARGPLPPPVVVHPATRTATAPSNAPTRRDRARAGQAVIAPSWHGSSATPLTHRRQDRFHRAFSADQHHWLGADRWNRDPRTGPRVANRRIDARRGPAARPGRHSQSAARPPGRRGARRGC